MLNSDDSPVRLRAAENALLAGQAGTLLADLTRLARTDSPAVRGASLAALGKFAFAASGNILAQARKDGHPLVRRGALWGYRNARQVAEVRPFLDDAAPLVRLAAIRAAGELKSAECADRLFELLLAARDEKTHLAARQSLRDVGTDRVSVLADKALRTLYEQFGQFNHPRGTPAGTAATTTTTEASEDPKAKAKADRARLQRARRGHYLQRNIRSCCWLLGEQRSTLALDLQFRMLEEVAFDSDVLIELGESLGKIGDPRAVKPLIEMVKRLKDQGMKYLWSITSPAPVYVPYNENGTAAMILAASRLGATDAVETIVGIALSKVRMARLRTPTAAAMKALVTLVRPENRKAIEGCVVNVLGDVNYGDSPRYMAAKAAGKLKIQGALEHLKTILYEDRPGRKMMIGIAWAIQEITQATPEIPDPATLQGDWIIRKNRARG